MVKRKKRGVGFLFLLSCKGEGKNTGAGACWRRTREKGGGGISHCGEARGEERRNYPVWPFVLSQKKGVRAPSATTRKRPSPPSPSGRKRGRGKKQPPTKKKEEKGRRAYPFKAFTSSFLIEEGKKKRGTTLPSMSCFKGGNPQLLPLRLGEEKKTEADVRDGRRKKGRRGSSFP